MIDNQKNPDFPPYAEDEYEEYLRSLGGTTPKNNHRQKLRNLFFSGTGLVVIPDKNKRMVTDILARS